MIANPPSPSTRLGAVVRATTAPRRLTHLALSAAVVAACAAPSPGGRPVASSPPANALDTAFAGSSPPVTTSPATRLAVLSGNPRDAKLAVVDASNRAIPIDLPASAIAWISADGAGRLVATTPDGRLFLAGPIVAGGDAGWRKIGDPGWREIVPAYGGARPLAPLSFATFAPDGRTIAALAADFGSGTDFDLVLVDAGTGAATALGIVAGPDGAAPAWLPDGRLLVVARDRASDRLGLLLVDPGHPDGAPRLEREAYGIALSEDGHVVAIGRADGRLGVGAADLLLPAVPAAGQAQPNDPPGFVVGGPPGTALGAFALDPSGTRLAVTWLDDVNGPATVMRFRVGPDGPVGEAPFPVPAGATSAVVAWLP